MVDFVRQVSSAFASSYTGAPTLGAVQATAGDMILAVYSYRKESADRIMAPPVWNGQTLVHLQARVEAPTGSAQQWVHMFYAIAATSGTYNLVGSVSVGDTIVLNASALVLSGPFDASPFSAISAQHQFTVSGYLNPSISMGGVATGDLVVDVLSAILWDENFTALPSTTWATAQSQVQRTTLSNTYNHVGNQLVSTKAGSGTVNVGYTPSAGKPGFVYFAFIVKSSAGGPVANPGLRLKVQDRLGAAEPNGSGFTVVARTGISATSVLYTTSAAAVASGLIEIDSDAIGSIGAVVHVAVAKQGASIPLDKNAAGRATVVDLNTADES